MEPTTVSLPWIEVAKLALGTGVIATIVAKTFDWLVDRYKAERLAEQDAGYLAARIAVILEQFAIKCAEQIGENNMYRASDGHAGHAHGMLPALADFPPEANWALLDPGLLSRTLSLPNELILADKRIAFWNDVDPDPSLLRNACDAQAGTCGYRSWRLASDLRSRYRLPDFSPRDFSWDPMATLKEHHDGELARIAAERRERS